MTCEYCSVFARNPCSDRAEASTCFNNSNRGACLDYKARDVAEWIRDNTTDKELLHAADIIEQKM